jgi:hypothetical protein
LLAIILASFPLALHADPLTCITSGDTTTCSDGTRYITSGDTTIGSDGTRCITGGDTTVCSDGSRWIASGDTTVGSDGTRCITGGDTTICRNPADDPSPGYPTDEGLIVHPGDPTPSPGPASPHDCAPWVYDPYAPAAVWDDPCELDLVGTATVPRPVAEPERPGDCTCAADAEAKRCVFFRQGEPRALMSVISPRCDAGICRGAFGALIDGTCGSAWQHWAN